MSTQNHDLSRLKLPDLASMQRTIDDMIDNSTQKFSPRKETNGNFNPTVGHSIQRVPLMDKSTTIAMKLKLAKSPNTSKASTPQKLPTPRLSPPKGPIESDPKTDPFGSILDPNFKTRSLMIDMIPKDLSLVTVKNYFNKFGKITNFTDPPRNSKSTNTKFVFIKFEKYESVDKALGE